MVLGAEKTLMSKNRMIPVLPELIQKPINPIYSVDALVHQIIFIRVSWWEAVDCRIQQDGFDLRQVWIHILASILSSSVSLAELLDLFVCQFFHLYKRDNTTCLSQVLNYKYFMNHVFMNHVMSTSWHRAQYTVSPQEMISAVDTIIFLHIIPVSLRALNARGTYMESCLFSPCQTSNRIIEQRWPTKKRQAIVRDIVFFFLFFFF